MTRLALSLVVRQVALEVALLALLWVVPGGRALLGLAPALGMFAGAYLAGRAGIPSERPVIRGLAIRSALAHAALAALGEGMAEVGWGVWGSTSHALGAIGVTVIVLGAMAWLLSLAGLDFGAYTKREA